MLKLGRARIVGSPHIGKQFGMLTVVEAIHETERSHPRYNLRCSCDCGNTVDTMINRLSSGRQWHCGCQIFGNSKTPESGAYYSMMDRCYNPRQKDYHNYGGRDIKVCQRWINSRQAFLADMGPKPTPNHSLDRIDTNGDYEPGNCRWATTMEQVHNRRAWGSSRITPLKDVISMGADE